MELGTGMTIGVDLRCLPADGSAGRGVAHAARFLLQVMLSQPVDWSWRVYLPKRASLTYGQMARNIRCALVKLDDTSGGSLRRALQESPCDLLFVPAGSAPPGISVPTIPWVHDLAIFDHPEWFGQSFLQRTLTTQLFRHGVVSAPIVFAVSQHTADDLTHRFHLKPERIRVTHEGGDPILAKLYGQWLNDAKETAKQELAERGITRPFILALGAVEARKNLSMLIEAWRSVRSSSASPFDLIIAGRGEEGEVENQEDGLHRLHDVSDAFRRALLLGAEIIALPSLHEGFGLVALEAMQAGTALLASNAGAIPEVAGESSLLLDPTDVELWKTALVEVMNNEEKRRQFAGAGKERARQFSWEKTGEIVLRGLAECIRK